MTASLKIVRIATKSLFSEFNLEIRFSYLTALHNLQERTQQEAASEKCKVFLFDKGSSCEMCDVTRRPSEKFRNTKEFYKSS